MKKLGTKIWIFMLAAPFLLVGFVFAFHWAFADDATKGTVVNDNLLNLGFIVTVLGFYGAFFIFLLYPVWIFLLIKSIKHKKN